MGICTFATQNSANWLTIAKYKFLDPVIRAACSITGTGLPKSALARLCAYMLKAGYKFKDIAAAAVRYCSLHNATAKEQILANELYILRDSTSVIDFLPVDIGLFETSGGKASSSGTGMLLGWLKTSLEKNAPAA